MSTSTSIKIVPQYLRERIGRHERRWRDALAIADQTVSPTTAQARLEAETYETYLEACEKAMICLDVDCYEPTTMTYCAAHTLSIR